jgi:hypothetical protein
MQVKILSTLIVILGFKILQAQSKTFAITNGKSPLSFATVINIRTGYGIFASEKGEFTLSPSSFLSGDTIKISYTGYADTLLKLPISSSEIALMYNAITLDNVDVYPCNKNKRIALKNYIKHKTNYSLGMGGSGSGTWASYVPNPLEIKGFIEEIIIEQSYFTVPAHARKAPFKIRLLHYDSITGLPGKPIIAKEWMIYPTSNKTVLNIQDEGIRLPYHGVVVCVDYFYAGEQFTYKRKVLQNYPDGSKRNEWETFYGASFRGTDGGNLIGKVYRRGKSDQWIQFNNFKKSPAGVMAQLSIKQCN